MPDSLCVRPEGLQLAIELEFEGKSLRYLIPRPPLPILVPLRIAGAVEAMTGGAYTADLVEGRDKNEVAVPVGNRTPADRIRDRHLGSFASVGEVLHAHDFVATYRFALRRLDAALTCPPPPA